MSLQLVSITELVVRVCVVDAADDGDAKVVAARTPREAWRVVHDSWPLVEVQALDGVPPAAPLGDDAP